MIIVWNKSTLWKLACRIYGDLKELGCHFFKKLGSINAA